MESKHEEDLFEHELKVFEDFNKIDYIFDKQNCPDVIRFKKLDLCSNDVQIE